MANYRKPVPKSQKEISNEQVNPYVNPDNGETLGNPNIPSEFQQFTPTEQSGIDFNRSEKLSFTDDHTKPFSVSIQDIDESVLFYFENVIRPYVYQNGVKIPVPLIYGAPEKWKSVQKDGYYKDKNGKIMSPIIMFKRDNMEKNRSITNKLDANNPHLYTSWQKSYNAKNSYSNFNILNNRIPTQQFIANVVPDYVTLTYSFIIQTYYVEQLNKIVESINYASDSYWGDPARFKFKAKIDSFTTITELNQDDDRVVRSTFTLTMNGYIVPDTIQKDATAIKKYNSKSKITIGLEGVDPLTAASNTPPPRRSSPILTYYTILDSLSNILYSGSISVGGTLSQIISNSTITNSLNTTLASVEAQGTIELADVDNIDSDGSTVPTPSGVPFTCTPIAPCEDATVTLNSITMDTIPSGDTENIQVLQSDDITEVGSKQGVHWRIADSNIQNSDGSYNVNIKAEDSLVLPDVTNTDSDGSPVVTPAQTPFVCTPPAPCDPYKTAKVMQTGQTTSFTTGDDITRGRDTDFFTLGYTNEWGHNFRFCGSTGGYSDGASYFDISGVATTRALAFPNLIIFDFSARDVDSILSYYIGDIASYGNQATQIAKHLTSTFGGLTGWNLWNSNELINVINIGVYPILTHYMSYPPFEFGSSNRYFWTESAYSVTHGFRTELRGITPLVGNGNASAYLGVWVRYTTLTELGL